MLIYSTRLVKQKPPRGRTNLPINPPKIATFSVTPK